MYEIFKKFGLTEEFWLLSMFMAALAGMYRIVETETTPSTRKILRIVIMTVISGVIVPGLLNSVLNITNAFWAGSYTGLTVLCFEPLIEIFKKKLQKKADDVTP